MKKINKVILFTLFATILTTNMHAGWWNTITQNKRLCTIVNHIKNYKKTYIGLGIAASTLLYTGYQLYKKSKKHFDYYKQKDLLHINALDGCTKTVTAIISACPKDKLNDLIMSKDGGGRTILQWAAGNKHEDTIIAIINACPKEKLADLIMSKDNGGQTALHWAAQNKNNNKITWIIINACPKDKLANLLMVKDICQATALHWAIYTQNTANAIALIKACPNNKLVDFLTAKNKRRETALASVKYNDIRTTLAMINEYESAILRINKIKNKLTHRDFNKNLTLKPNTPLYDIKIKIQRHNAKYLLKDLFEIYLFLSNTLLPAERQTIKQAIKKTTSNILAYCIYNTNKLHTLSDHKKQLDTYIAAILDEDKSIKIPQHIKNYYYSFLNDQPIANKQNYTKEVLADIKENFYATPEKLEQEIEFTIARKKIWPNKLSNCLRYQKNNMREAAYNTATTFSGKSLYKPDVEFVFN